MDINRKELFIEYIKENQENFYRLVYSYVNNPDTTLDLIQESIVLGLKNIEKLKEPQYIKTWFYRILVNTCLSYLRKNKKLPQFEVLCDNIQDRDNCFDEVKRKEILDIISTLDPELKTIVFLKFYEEMTFLEISKVTKVNVNTIKSRLYKALSILEDKLVDYNDESRC